ncbi:MAG: NAD-binding protein [Promethearchaeota archaeon]
MTKFKKYQKSLILHLKDNLTSIIIVAVWFLIGATYFIITESNATPLDILLLTFYLKEPENNDIFIAFYRLIGTIIISQGVFQIIIERSSEKSNPQLTCKEIAKDIKEPIVVFHHGHVGKRVTDYLREQKIKYIVVEEDEKLVEELLDAGEPVVVGSPTKNSLLDLIDIKNAKAIIVATHETKNALIISNKIRDINPNCPMAVRIFEDELRKALEQPPYNAFCFSTSFTSLERIKDKLIYGHKGRALVISVSHFTTRLAYELYKAGREIIIIDKDEDDIEHFKAAPFKAIEGDPTSLSFLETPNIDLKSIEQVFIGAGEDLSHTVRAATQIKRKYPEIEVYVRIFNDDLAEFLNKFGIQTFSTSKFTFEIIKEKFLDQIISEIKD